MEAVCPVCGMVYNIPDGRSRWAVEAKFLKHKDNCKVPEPGEFIRLISTVVRVVLVDMDSEEFPLVEVLYASGRRGVYRMATIGRVQSQEKAAEKFRAAGGSV